MRILWDNEIDKRDPNDFSSQYAGFPATNVKVHHLAVPWRTLTLGGQYYTLDAGEENTIVADCAAIAGHNLNGLNKSLCDHGDCESTDAPHVTGDGSSVDNCTFARSDEQAHEGSYSYKITKTSPGSPARAYLVDNADTDDLHGFIPGCTCRMRAHVYLPSSGGPSDVLEVVMQLLWYVPGDGWSAMNPAASEQDNWEMLEIEGIKIPEAATAVVPCFLIESTAGGGEFFYVDDINIDQVAVCRIMANDIDVWAAPSLSQAFTWSAGPMMAFFASTAWRFWRFEFDDPANPDGYISIGRLGLGSYLQMPPIEPGAGLPLVSTSQFSTSPGGQIYGDKGVLLLSPTFSLPIVSDAQRQEINAMFAEAHHIKPVFLVVWEDSLTVQGPIYCRIDQDKLDYKMAPEAGVLWSLDLAFMEVR